MSTMADTTRAKWARRCFSDEFKAQTARLVLDEGKSVTTVARELDLVPSAVGVWVKHALSNRTKGRTCLTTAEREELARLRKRIGSSRKSATSQKGRRPSSRSRAGKVSRVLVRTSLDESARRYGSPQILKDLFEQDIPSAENG